MGENEHDLFTILTNEGFVGSIDFDEIEWSLSVKLNRCLTLSVAGSFILNIGKLRESFDLGYGSGGAALLICLNVVFMGIRSLEGGVNL